MNMQTPRVVHYRQVGRLDTERTFCALPLGSDANDCTPSRLLNAVGSAGCMRDANSELDLNAMQKRWKVARRDKEP